MAATATPQRLSRADIGALIGNATTPRAHMFDPTDYSLQELEFLLANLGKSANVALYKFRPIPGVNPVQIRKGLTQLSEYAEMAAGAGVEWIGYDSVRDACEWYMEWTQQSLAIKDAGGPRHPSMMAFDSIGTITPSGIGADSCDRVRTGILPNGDRKPFAISLRGTRQSFQDLMPWTKRKPGTVVDATQHDAAARTFTCGVCGDLIAKYTAGSARSQGMARKKVEQHLKTTRREAARHREVLRREFA
jgi:hypothetical protein